MTTTRKVRRRAATGQLARYLGAPYVRMIIPNAEEGGYLAEVLELPGCITDGDTLEEAYRNLEDAMAGWIEASLENGRPIPEPVGDREYSGHFPLRMSTELHRAAALRAIQEGVSLNQWIVGAIAQKVAKEDLAGELGVKIASEVLRRISVDVSAAVRVRLGEATMAAPSPSDFIEAGVGRSTTEDIVVTPEPGVLTTERALWRAVNVRQAGVEVNQDA
jgi:antitoxin HicB